jgi:xanthine dehydrogenase accessory factor
MIPSQAQLSFSFGESAGIADAPNLAFDRREMFLLTLTMSQNLQRLDQLSAGRKGIVKRPSFVRICSGGAWRPDCSPTSSKGRNRKNGRQMLIATRKRRPVALVLGTNEIASAVAVYMHRAGWACIVGNDSFPPVIRRGMAYHDVLFGDRVAIDNIEGVAAENALELFYALEDSSRIVVTPLQVSELIALRAPDALIDARMQKYRVTPDWRHIAPLTVGLGPNFVVRANCDVAIETRPARVGRVLESGGTDAPDHQPNRLGGVGGERFAYSDREGLWHSALNIGVRVFKGFVVGHLDGLPVRAPLDGVIRGLVRDGLRVPGGVKLLEIDPRGRSASWTGIDERSRAIAEAVMKAIWIKQAESIAARVSQPLVLH